MSEMRERVARAISLTGATSHASIRKARRVLVELLVPTAAMLDAARDWSVAKYGKPIGNDAAIGCWQAMIAEAMK